MKSSLLESVGFLFACFVCVVIGAVATLYVYTIKIQSTVKLSPQTTESQKSDTVISEPFALVPPAQSLKGILADMTGSVLQKTRDANAFVEATRSATILVGESIATGKDSTAIIQIPRLSVITMEKNAEIVFVNIFPQNSVFQQKSGEIQYEIIATSPVAIRALHTLIQASEAKFTVNIIDSDISVIVQKGEAKAAIVDTDNSTHVYTIPEGKRANIDDSGRTVTLVSPRQ